MADKSRKGPASEPAYEAALSERRRQFARAGVSPESITEILGILGPPIGPNGLPVHPPTGHPKDLVIDKITTRELSPEENEVRRQLRALTGIHGPEIVAEMKRIRTESALKARNSPEARTKRKAKNEAKKAEAFKRWAPMIEKALDGRKPGASWPLAKEIWEALPLSEEKKKEKVSINLVKEILGQLRLKWEKGSHQLTKPAPKKRKRGASRG